MNHQLEERTLSIPPDIHFFPIVMPFGFFNDSQLKKKELVPLIVITFEPGI